MEKINYKLINILLIIISVFFVSKSIDIYKNILLLLLEVIFPIFLSFFISYSLYPCVCLFKRKLSYTISCFVVILICFFLGFSLIYVSVPIITHEITLISDDIMYFLSKLSFLTEDIKTYFYSFLSVDNGINIINTGASFLTKFVIVIVLSIYFLFNMSTFKKYFRKHNLTYSIDRDLHNYYKGFYLVIFIEIIEYFIVYFLIGHPYFLLLALLSGITSVIPFFGAFFTNFLALISSFSISFSLFIMTAIVMIIIPLLNSYFIEPRIYKKTLKVSLISIILSCFIFGSLFGLVGIIFAIPFFLIIKNLWLFFFSKTYKI